MNLNRMVFQSIVILFAVLLTGIIPVNNQLFAQENSQEKSQQDSQQESGKQDEQSQEASREFKNFVEVVKKSSAVLQGAKNYRVKVACDFTATGGDAPIKETIHLVFASDQQQMRLNVQESVDGKPEFVVCYHDSKLVRYSPIVDKYSSVTTDDPRNELQTCTLTHGILEMGAVSFLVMPNAGDTVISELAHVRQFQEDDGREHFELTMIDGRHIDVWFNSGDAPLPVEVRNTVTTAIGNDLKMETVRHSKLVWERDVDMPEDTFKFQPPESATMVEDLTASIAGRGTEDLIGKPLPELGLVDMEQKATSLDKVKQPMLLYFWGTWAAPSVEQIPSILQFADKLKSQGVRVIAVNVADSNERLQAFIKANKIKGEVLQDHDGNAAHELRLSHLPAVVLVDAENNVKAIYQNATAEIRPQIVDTLGKMQSK